MDIEHLANTIFTKYPPGSFVPKEWMHEQFGYDFKTARMSLEHIPYAQDVGSLRRHLLVLNRVLRPRQDGWEVLLPNQHSGYGLAAYQRACRKGYREFLDIVDATEIRKLSASERRELQDAKNHAASVRDMLEKEFSRKSAFEAFSLSEEDA